MTKTVRIPGFKLRASKLETIQVCSCSSYHTSPLRAADAAITVDDLEPKAQMLVEVSFVPIGVTEQ